MALSQKTCNYLLYAAAAVGIVLLLLYVVRGKAGNSQARVYSRYHQRPASSVQHHPHHAPSSPCMSGSCPSYGKPRPCPTNNLVDELKRPYLSVPTDCRDTSRNSPQAQPTLSPWVKDRFEGSPPVGGGVPDGKTGDLKRVFDSCQKCHLNPAHPIGIDCDDCVSCGSGKSVEACWQQLVE